MHIKNDKYRLSIKFYLLVSECRTTVANPLPGTSVPESDKPCIFLFLYNGKEFNECTSYGYESQFWCGTTYSVKEFARWGMCFGPCPFFPGE